MLACHPLSCMFGGTENGDNGKMYSVSSPAWGGDTIFHSAGLLLKTDLFISRQQSHVAASSSLWAGGWGWGWVAGLTEPKAVGSRPSQLLRRGPVQVCSSSRQRQRIHAVWGSACLLVASLMVSRSLPACLSFDSQSSQRRSLSPQRKENQFSWILYLFTLALPSDSPSRGPPFPEAINYSCRVSSH